MFEFIAQIFRNMFVFVGMVTTKSSFPPALTPEDHEVSIMMCYLFNGTVHRIPVGMYIHNAHEDGYH